MTHPTEPQGETPMTDAQVVTGQVCEDFQNAKGKWVTQVKYEMNKAWVFADFARTLELALRRRDTLLRKWYASATQNDVPDLTDLIKETERALAGD